MRIKLLMLAAAFVCSTQAMATTSVVYSCDDGKSQTPEGGYRVKVVKDDDTQKLQTEIWVTGQSGEFLSQSLAATPHYLSRQTIYESSGDVASMNTFSYVQLEIFTDANSGNSKLYLAPPTPMATGLETNCIVGQ